MLKFLKRLTLFLLVVTVALEVLFRTLVPASQMPRGAQNQAYGIKHLEVSNPRSGLHTIGRLAQPRFRWQVNDAGFNSAWEYKSATERDKPCVAVVGHSYVEGFYSDVEEHMAGLLQSHLDNQVEVYNFATSGMPLSQGRRVIRYARDNFQPSTYVVFVGFSSLKASSRDLGFVPYAEQVVTEGSGFKEVGPSPMVVNRNRRYLAYSATIRYLFYNAKLTFGRGQKVAVARNVEGEIVDDSDRAYLTRVADHVLAGMRADAPEANIVLVCDADRAAMYSTHKPPTRLLTSLILEEVCPRHNVRLVDLSDPFWQEFSATGRLLNFKDNYHWDPATSDLVARVIIEQMGPDFMTGSPGSRPDRVSALVD